MAAAGGGHLLCAQQLLDWGAEASCSAPDGTTALMVAASGGHSQCVAALIKAGANVDSHDHSGMSAMMLAAAAGHIMVLRCLIRHKAALERLSFQVWCTCKHSVLAEMGQSLTGSTPGFQYGPLGHCTQVLQWQNTP